MRVVTPQELQDYLRCPLYHEKKYLLKEAPPRRRDQAHFDGHSAVMLEAQQAVDQLASGYLHKLMDGRQPMYSTLVKRWQKLWWSGISGQEIMEMITPPNRASKIAINTAVLGGLPRFYELFHKPFMPDLVDAELTFYHQQVAVPSHTRMGYRISKNVMRLIRFTPYKKAHNPLHNLELVVQGCAWLKQQEEERVQIGYFRIGAYEELGNFTLSQLDQRAVEELQTMLDKFLKGETLREPRCRGCEYKCTRRKHEA